jgi:hypothetical protein
MIKPSLGHDNIEVLNQLLNPDQTTHMDSPNLQATIASHQIRSEIPQIRTPKPTNQGQKPHQNKYKAHNSKSLQIINLHFTSVRFILLPCKKEPTLPRTDN